MTRRPPRRVAPALVAVISGALARLPGGHACDDAGWSDSGGFPCSFYTGRALCTADGGYGAGWGNAALTFADSADAEGRSAADVCCGCGGTGTGTGAPGASSTMTTRGTPGVWPTLSPAAPPAGATPAECVDRAGWADSVGSTCAVYASRQLCAYRDGRHPGPGWNSAWGGISDFAAGGVDAFAACCACRNIFDRCTPPAAGGDEGEFWACAESVSESPPPPSVATFCS